MTPARTPSAETQPSVLILTPVKDARRHLDRYVALIEAIAWPRERLSIGILEGDSVDDTWGKLAECRPRLERRCSRVTFARRDFGFRMPAGVPRWAPAYQLVRRGVLARARNNLLSRALGGEDWVLWIDVDVVDYPPDILPRLLGTGCDIVHPHCVERPGGRTFDLNAWADRGARTMADLRGAGIVRLDAVGGTMLLVRADLHRDGLIFPPFRYGLPSQHIRARHPLWGCGEIETEGFGALAADMGVQCWGLPDIEIVHASD
jgi:peptide chain release factor subunit 1